MLIIFASCLGRFPIGGHAWADLQYLLGLRNLGHDVFYLEECGLESWVYNWETDELTTELEYPTNYVKKCLNSLGFENQWIYRAGEQSIGMALDEFQDVCAQADLMIIRGATLSLWRDEYTLPKCRIFIDSDPGFTQVKVVNGDTNLVNTLEHCEHLFTVGLNLGTESCLVPTLGKHWIQTVQPVVLPHWPFKGEESATYFSSVMQWRSYREMIYNGVSYGNKDKEFPKFIQLPKLTQQPFNLAISGGDPDELSRNGWQVVTGWSSSFTPEQYQGLIQTSKAEFGVAKQGYVASQSGWFSDRSVCYLASGRPVLIQDTGLSQWLPTGEGLLTFSDLAEALVGVDSINANYENHSRTARKIAESYFNSDTVLCSLLEAAMN